MIRPERSSRPSRAKAMARRRPGQEAVTEAVDHVENGVRVRERLPHRWQRMYRVEHARKKRERQDDEIGKSRELIDLLRLDAGDDAERGHDAAAGYGVRDHPLRVRDRHI